MEKCVGIIPARMHSSRLPGKPMALIGSMTMIERVWRSALEVLDRVVVATDSRIIADEVRRFGGEFVLTSPDIPNGTLRCLEAARSLGIDADRLIVNIQGDEPFLDSDDVRRVIDCYRRGDAAVATLACRFDPNAGIEALSSPGRVKVVMDNNNFALYFSRSVIPFVRDCDSNEWPRHAAFYIHHGIYAYTRAGLESICQSAPSHLETAENLEQLRWLQAGYKVRLAITDREAFSVDTPDDLAAARQLIATHS